MTGLLEFFHEAFSMPTAVFSVLLVLVVLYWLVAIFGGFHLDSLEGIHEAADSLHGAFEGAADGALEAADSLHGAFEGAHEALEGAHDAGVDGGHHGFFELVGVSEMPKSIFLSFFVFFAWLFSFLGMRYVPQLVSAAFHGVVLAVVLSGFAVVLGIAAAVALMVPLARFFAAAPATTSRDLVGRICTVRTLRVTPSFGQAVIEDDQGSYLVSVRAEEPNTLTRGARALIFDFDSEHEVFLVSQLPFGENVT